MRWLRKAILRAAGTISLHDETIAFANETEVLRDQARRPDEARLDWLAGLASFKAVMLEGLEVVFIVIAVGAGRGLLGAASLGALAACLVVVAVGFVVHRPLARVPENTLKFAVGTDAVRIRGILGRRRARRSMAGRGLCHSSVCSAIPNRRTLRRRPHASRRGRAFDMTMLVTAFRMLVGLFVDDGSLALAIIVIVLLSSILANLMPDWPLAAGAVLLVGCLGVPSSPM